MDGWMETINASAANVGRKADKKRIRMATL